jgi:DNA-binding transcriptional LysR family regulator
MLDRLTGMQVFLRTAALGSFSAAGRAMGLSQTMVTKHVEALETRLGARLFQRTTRRLSLTDAGRLYLETCIRILPDIEDAERAILAERVEASGLLRLNAPVSFGGRHIAPALAEFAASHPRVTIELGLNDRVVDLVEEGWDLTIRIGHLASSTLIARQIAKISILICAAPSYLARSGTPRTVADLGRHACLGYTLSTAVGPDRWLFGTRSEISIAITGTLRSNNGDALREAAIAGQGIIYQPRFLLHDALADGRLIPLALDHPPLPPLGVHAVWADRRHVSAKVRAMIDFLTARFANPPWGEP